LLLLQLPLSPPLPPPLLMLLLVHMPMVVDCNHISFNHYTSATRQEPPAHQCQRNRRGRILGISSGEIQEEDKVS
jgi:hypothetical protein